MSGYEELTPEQIMHLAKMCLAAVIAIMVSRVVPAILEFKKIKYLEVVITTKQCDKEPTLTFFQRLSKWIKNRKKEEPEEEYLRRWASRRSR